jgi:SAM-dependent methyltransferase
MLVEGPAREVWEVGAAYERYVGRWSRLVARDFLRWLGVEGGRDWLDVGCGTGALAEVILREAGPRAVVGVDRAPGFVAHARASEADPRARFEVGDAEALPVAEGAFDAVVSGLALNFVGRPDRMVSEMARACRLGGRVALYVWDYAGGMEPIARFWSAARELDPRAAALDEAVRFPVCAPGALADLFRSAGLLEVETRAVEPILEFRGFDDYWSPFLGGQGPAPAYVVSLPEERRQALRDALRESLPVSPGGTIRLGARAWAVQGTRNGLGRGRRRAAPGRET